MANDKAMARSYDPTRAQEGEGTVFRKAQTISDGTVLCETGNMVIPTYMPPEPEEMPVYSEYRQHQGSTGNAYPNRPTLNAEREVLTDRDYTVIRLENKYVRLLILPEIGGRIFEAYDKVNDYNFLFRHHRIKPVIVGIYGSWITGGMEFNFPIHHRPSTFLPVDYTTEVREDGAVIVWMSEAAPTQGQYRLKGTYGICLRPDAAFFETIVKIDNRTPVKHPFMWWENAAIHVNKDYQLFFPQDVGYVHHHYDRHHATFPISKGWYAVENHAEETDISRHPNTIKGNSYFASPSKYDFYGGYDNNRECGTVHVADHHISPGKKMFQWALEDLGDAWNNNQSDNDGEHAELMAGSFNDDQPDFTYIAPYEVKRFSQFWFPIHGTGLPIFGNINGVISMDRDAQSICLAVTKPVKGAAFEVSYDGEVLLSETVDLEPGAFKKFDFKAEEGKKYTFAFKEADGTVLMDYTEDVPDVLRIPEDNTGIPTPEELTTAEELTNTGLHIDQYRDPSWNGRDYFKRALERDPAYVPALLAMAEDALNRYKYEEGLGNLSVMGHYMLADILDGLGKTEEADAVRACVKKHYVVDIFPYRPEEVEVLERAAKKNTEDAVAPYLLGCLLYEKKQTERAVDCLKEAARRDPSCYLPVRGIAAAYFSRLEKREESLPLYKKAMEMAPGNELLLIEVNFVMNHLGVDPEERLSYLLAHKPEKAHDQLTWEIAACMNDCGKFDEAIQCMLGHELVAAECQETYLTESWTFANVAKGRELMAVGKYAEALPYLEAAQKIQPNFRAGWWDTQALYYPRVFEAKCRLALGDEAGAKAKAAEVLPFIHSNYSPYMGPETDSYVAEAMRILGDKVNARKFISEAIVRWEKQLSGAVGGNGYKAYGDGRRDIKPIVTALFYTTIPDGVKEHDSELYNALGRSRLFFGDTEGAKKYFEKSLALDPSNHKARFECRLMK